MRNELKFDKRVVERNLRSGYVSREEYRRHIEELKDLSDGSDVFEAHLNPIGRKVPTSILDNEDDGF